MLSPRDYLQRESKPSDLKKAQSLLSKTFRSSHNEILRMLTLPYLYYPASDTDEGPFELFAEHSDLSCVVYCDWDPNLKKSDLTPWGSSEFLRDEFDSRWPEHRLKDAIEADGIRLSEETEIIERLNRLLRGTELDQIGDQLREAGIFRQSDAEWCARRAQPNLDRYYDENERVKQNRLILEAAYPLRCPHLKDPENTPVNSCEFQEGEFSGRLAPHRLIQAIKDDRIRVPKGKTEIERLNTLLRGTELHQTGEQIKRVGSSLRLDVGCLGRSGLISNENERVKQNRRILEAAFPLKCPRLSYHRGNLHLEYEKVDSGELHPNDFCRSSWAEFWPKDWPDRARKPFGLWALLRHKQTERKVFFVFLNTEAVQTYQILMELELWPKAIVLQHQGFAPFDKLQCIAGRKQRPELLYVGDPTHKWSGYKQVSEYSDPEGPMTRKRALFHSTNPHRTVSRNDFQPAQLKRRQNVLAKRVVDFKEEIADEAKRKRERDGKRIQGELALQE